MREDARVGLEFELAVAGELAQLEVLRRMLRGATHAWNNALTAILGDVRCLLEERRGDPAVAAAAAAIEREAQRCARLTRALQGRAEWRPGEPGEVDLGALARGLEPVLRDTLTAAVALSWDVPAETPWVRARRVDAELLVLLAVQAVARDAAGGTELRIAIGKQEDRHVSVSIERSATEPAPSRATEAWDALVGQAARMVAASCDAEWSVEPAAGRAHVRFACA